MKKRIIQLFVTLLLFITSLIVVIVAGDKVRNRDIQYDAVKVTVISAEKQWVTGYSGYYTYHVTVEYEGKNYELINVKSGEFSKYEALANLKPELQYDNPYFDNIVYYSNGNMYSNTDGIRTDSNVFDLKKVGFAGVFVFGLLHMMCVVYDQANKSDIDELVRLRIAYMIDDFGQISNDERTWMETQLMKQLIEYGKGQNLCRINLMATEEGYPIYQKLGFEDKVQNYRDMRLRL